MKKIGFTIGKFAPLHKGHEYLIEMGLKEMDEFYVIVYETDNIPIPIQKRAQWIRELYPDVKIKYAKNPPMQYGLDEESVQIQVEYLKNIVGKIPVTHFYSSEKYGEYVAKHMHVEDKRIDEARKIVPISATKIREDLEENKKYLELLVYYDVKSINKK